MLSCSLMNPYYVAYAKAHNRTAEQQLAHDRKAWSGGCMCGFILWIAAQKRLFWERFGTTKMLDRHTICDHKAWGAFLKAEAARRYDLRNS